MKRASFLLGMLILVAGLGLAYLYAGWFNVAATEPHTPLGRWLFSTTMKQSVAHHARGIEAPPREEFPLSEGYRHYGHHCEMCHGGPGVEGHQLAEGLRPPPPDLTETAHRWERKELYWIIKNGIRMTGMPAWGDAYTEEELWLLAGFVKQLPEIPADKYKALKKAAESEQLGARGQQRNGQGSGSGGSLRVTMTDALRFQPNSVTIRAGETVQWRNDSELVHTVTADPQRVADSENVALPAGAETFHSGNVAPGQSFRHTFKVPGRYRYFCVPHEAAGMVAEIVVKE